MNMYRHFIKYLSFFSGYIYSHNQCSGINSHAPTAFHNEEGNWKDGVCAKLIAKC